MCDGWVSLAANDVTRWRPPAEAKGAPPESLPGKTHRFWVATRAGVAVRANTAGAGIRHALMLFTSSVGLM